MMKITATASRFQYFITAHAIAKYSGTHINLLLKVNMKASKNELCKPFKKRNKFVSNVFNVSNKFIFWYFKKIKRYRKNKEIP